MTQHLTRNTRYAIRQPITWLLLSFLFIASLYALTTPLFEASDELWHYPMVQHLSRGGALPVQDPNNVGPWRQEASQPPLYYYLMGWATAWIDTGDMVQVRWLNPHVDNGIITPDGNTNLAIHTLAENWPWYGTVLAVRLVRLLSVLKSAGTVLFTYLLAREFFDDEISRLAATGFVAFVPMFAFISGAVNNDNLASLLSAVILYMLVRLVTAKPQLPKPQNPNRPSVRPISSPQSL
ncbi:MAG TPA: glycosyltransferase family 39 protein, partial [Anaerolineales bacterium]|nr:glycosyltransferase family 39 protein [Anaerolineales bacterium]